MAMMMGEFYDKDAIMDCPVGGASSIVNALVRGIEKNGGKVFVKSHAVSGSGMIAANTVSLDSIGKQLGVLQKLKVQS